MRRLANTLAFERRCLRSRPRWLPRHVPIPGHRLDGPVFACDDVSMNFVYLSPHFPPNYYRFCAGLREEGVNVLGLADAPYGS